MVEKFDNAIFAPSFFFVFRKCECVTIVTLLVYYSHTIGSSVDIFVKAIGGMTIVTYLGNQFKVC